MKGLDPVAHGQKVALAVYRPETNERLVQKFRPAASYGGTTSIDVVGCNYLCAGCWVDKTFLIGRGPRLERELKSGRVRYYTPKELAGAVIRFIKQEKTPRRIKISSSEPFLTPEWLLGLMEELKPFLEKHGEQFWVETNGSAVAQDPRLADRVAEHRNCVRFFVSSKNSPELFTRATRVQAKYADVGFQCLELLWQRRVVAFLQAPLASFFFDSSFEWYLQRLLKIHPAAPLLMHIDSLQCLPIRRVVGDLKSAGIFERRRDGNEARRQWKSFLEKHYGRKMSRISFDVDGCPEDQNLVRQFVFENRSLEEFPLFV